MLNLVCFSPHVPYPGIDHAGGGALQSYIDLTHNLGRRTLVAPVSDANLRGEPDNLDQLHLIQQVRTPSGDIRDRIARSIPRFQLSPSVRHAFIHDEVTVAALRRADVVEYHWEDMARALLPGARRLAPNARHVVFLHDVVSQGLRRAASTKTGLRAVRAHLSTRLAELDEATITSMADAVIVLSEKDRDLLRDQHKVVVQRPVVRVKPSLVRRPQGDATTFVFVAAFDRPSNIQAAEWLRYEVWPQIRAEVRNAELKFAGSGSDTQLIKLLNPSLGVDATGYVEDLDALYLDSDIALIPLQHGAGVKFKTLEAMITATPAVSTSIGSEGIDRAPEFIEIADRPCEFAMAAIRLAKDRTGVYVSRAVEGARWTMDAHGEAQCRTALTRAITGR